MHTPVRYSPDATHPDWDAALAAIPEEVRGWLQLRYGQGVTGHMTPDDLLVVQDGGGENGKTTYAVAVRGALGDYYVAISHRALLGDPSQHPTELGRRTTDSPVDATTTAIARWRRLRDRSQLGAHSAT
jgi:putative DNA primase/helicase